MERYRVASIIKDETFFFWCTLSRCRSVRRRNVDGRMIGEEELGRILHSAVFAELRTVLGFPWRDATLHSASSSCVLALRNTLARSLLCLTVTPAVD